MSITGALASANSGLSVAAARANVASNNIANALTPGYSRRDVSVSENTLGGLGGGVTLNGITRAADPAITSALRSASASQNREQEIAAAYTTLNSALGDPEDGFSLFAQYQGLETALRALSQTPESQILQTDALTSAKALAASFNDLSNLTQTTRQNADAEIARQVNFVNDALERVVDLNSAISRSKPSGLNTQTLEDQRKTLIDQISSIIPVKEVQRENGKIDLITQEGVFLTLSRARQISFTPAGVITPAMTFAGGSLSGLSVEGTDITPGANSNSSAKEGSLAGLFEVRDNLAPNFQTQIDALARDVIERFEGLDPTLAPGDPGLFTDAGAAFDPTAETGLAGRIAVNAAVDPAQGGALWRIRDGLGAAAQGASGNANLIIVLLDSFTAMRIPPPGAGVNSQVTAAGAAASIATQIGSARITSDSLLATKTAQTQVLNDAELAATAVDTDAELQQLLLIEQAYAANARVIETADQMIRTLLEL